MIPKKLNFIEMGGKSTHETVIKCMSSWQPIYPDYQIKIWHEEEIYNILKTLPGFVDIWNKDTNMGVRSGLGRMGILYVEGGIYLDTDIEAKINAEHFWKDEHGFVGTYPQYNNRPDLAHLFGVDNAFMGFEPRHPFMQEIVERLPQWYEQHKYLSTYVKTGTDYFTQMFREWDLKNPNQVAKLPHNVCCAGYRLGMQKDPVYSIHYLIGSWLK